MSSRRLVSTRCVLICVISSQIRYLQARFDDSGVDPCLSRQCHGTGACTNSVTVATFNDLRSALIGCAPEVRIAPGTYTVTRPLEIIRDKTITVDGSGTVELVGADEWTDPKISCASYRSSWVEPFCSSCGTVPNCRALRRGLRILHIARGTVSITGVNFRGGRGGVLTELSWASGDIKDTPTGGAGDDWDTDSANGVRGHTCPCHTYSCFHIYAVFNSQIRESRC